MLDLFLQPEILAIFATLLVLEIILGVDNVVFISVLCERLPEHKRRMARNWGISLAVITRIALVFSISWVMSLTKPLISISEMSLTGRELIMIFGGSFLLIKSSTELWSWLKHTDATHATHVSTGLTVVLLQIVAVDAVFSMDSVITAVGLTSEVPVMVAAILVSAFIMVLTAEKINNVVTKYPGFKTLALLFLVLLGALLIAEGFAIYINKGYIYFAMAFGLILELCHIQIKKKHSKPFKIKSISKLRLKAKQVSQ
ncbi:TerC family protein [Vibrio parahaemolyticus]|uniref:TerC family protein n=1 Tax=Vibrio alginolyticus TaxID=663 RepID=UPI001D36EAF9|nr:TerC family protein [Vibrio alginolyticus]EGR2744537.1 TerC family protein [Vibrio parahaemolyticus]EGR2875329.1 TerC family protein [Vibrio parahaemolyticus]EJC7064093.1 TerC family protein [Vibrio parahaemolyticus]EJF9997159.1 TerC family protein [Vibrio parahaemolyticus]EJG0201045.1 TerC family protein [Vibrio parahaemolyticus]